MCDCWVQAPRMGNRNLEYLNCTSWKYLLFMGMCAGKRFFLLMLTEIWLKLVNLLVQLKMLWAQM